MKKFLSVFILCFALILSLNIFASALPPAVVDNGACLDESEIAFLTEKLDDIRETYGFDVAVVTEEVMSADYAEAAADDIFDYNGYGYGENRDGILFYICTGERKYHFSTHAYGMTAFNDDGLIYLEDKVLPYLKESDYYGAMNAFADTSEELLGMAASGEPYTYEEEKNKVIPFAITYVAAFLLALFMTVNKQSKMKTTIKQEYANDYMKQGSMQLNFSSDVFLYSHVSRTKRAESGSRGGSSSHTSSSGSTHGGRGGSF